MIKKKFQESNVRGSFVQEYKSPFFQFLKLLNYNNSSNDLIVFLIGSGLKEPQKI